MSEDYNEEKERGYRVLYAGMRGVIKVLLVLCVVVLLIFLAQQSYKLGYAVFNEEAVDSGEGREVQVTIEDGMSVTDIAELLQDKGLIQETPLVFRIQEYMSDYHGEIRPGTYTLRTSMNVEDMIRVMSGRDTTSG